MNDGEVFLQLIKVTRETVSRDPKQNRISYRVGPNSKIILRILKNKTRTNDKKILHQREVI